MKKQFFRERSVKEIQRLNCREVYRARGLVEKIMSLNPKNEGLILRFRLIPTKFGKNNEIASRKNLRHGQYFELEQPYSVEKCLRTREIPLEIRQKALSRLTRIPEEENFCLGYSYRPPFDSKDKTRIYVPFWSIMDGCFRDTYDGRVCKEMPPDFNAGSKIEFDKGGQRVEREGLVVIVKVPSSTQSHGKYRIKWIHVPVVDNEWKRVICWKTRPAYGSEVPAHKEFNIRYLEASTVDDSDFHMIYPQEVHAWHVIVRYFMSKHNLVPFERSQIAIPSKAAAEFWNKICNNVIIYDPSINNGKGGYRHLHIDEKSMLQARQIGVLGPEKIMYWDAERDGRIRDYNWGNFG
ncbi:MAG: hypothetical protein QXF25_02270 [Candidatus Pacearchaeota archaeon]